MLGFAGFLLLETFVCVLNQKQNGNGEPLKKRNAKKMCRYMHYNTFNSIHHEIGDMLDKKEYI